MESVESARVQTPRQETHGRAFSSALVTLTLSILGSSVLPVPYAISRTGVLMGVITAGLVSYANSLTGVLLVHVAGATGKKTYEALAEKLGGRGCKVFTQAWLIVLLFGTLCGDFALVADTGRLAVEKLMAGAAPAWLVGGDGRLIMTLISLGIVFPLSCLRHIRKLEQVAIAGFALVLWLMAVIVTQSARAGFPAVRSGELPLTRIRFSADLPEAVGVLSFAFYMHPMLLPLLAEMPRGVEGERLTTRATQLVTSGVALAVYLIVGVAAAARYGQATAGDVLLNEWAGGLWDGALDAAVVLYLAFSIVPIVLTLRLQIDTLVLGPAATRPGRRHRVVVAGGVVLCALAVALAFPTYAEKMFAVTGASAVCVVCYVLPVVFHLLLYYRKGAAAPLPGTQAEPLLAGSAPTTPVAEGLARRSSSILDLSAVVMERLTSGEGDADDKLCRRTSTTSEEGGRDLELEAATAAALAKYPSAAQVAARGCVWARAAGTLRHVVMPLAVLVVGVLTSILGLVLAVQQLVR